MAGGGEELRVRLGRLEAEAEGGDLWSNPERAGKELKRIAGVRSELEALEALHHLRDEALIALELAQMEAQEEQGGGEGGARVSPGGGNDEAASSAAAFPSLHAEACEAVERLGESLDTWEDERLLGGPYDDRVRVDAGPGRPGEGDARKRTHALSPPPLRPFLSRVRMYTKMHVFLALECTHLLLFATSSSHAPFPPQSFSLPHPLSQPSSSLQPALVTITAGAGGADAADWAGMLSSMYTRWGESHGMSVSVLDASPAERGGFKSIELRLEGPRAYGLLQGERGAHRLVRNSPFNAKGLRQTSFAGVGVAPELREEDYLADPELRPLLQIAPSDLVFETMRSSGAGGQHVNTTDSAVRVRHLPTGLAARCEAERSQARNREGALRSLRSKLAQRACALRADLDRRTGGQPVEASWGNQVRNYVLAPYSLVKDAATGLETQDVQRVLEGTGLDAFVRQGVRARKERERKETTG